MKDRAPLDAAVILDFVGGESSLTLNLDGYSPSKILRLSGRYTSIKPWLDIPYAGSITVRAPAFDPSRLAYELKLSGALPPGIFRGDRPAALAEITARGDVKSISVDKARVQLGSDSFGYSGTFRFADLSPDGVLDVRLSLMKGALDLSSSLRIVGNKGEYVAMAEKTTIGKVVIADLALTAARKGSLADFNLSFRPPVSRAAEPEESGPQFSGEGGAVNGNSIVHCEGSLSLGDKPNLELSVNLETIDMAPLEPLLALVFDSRETAALLSSLKLGGSFFATSDFKRLSWSAADLTLVSSSLPGAYALLSLSGTGTSVAIKHALVSYSGFSVEGLGKLDFTDAGRLGFEANLALNDISYSFKGNIVGRQVFITGDYGLQFSQRTVGKDSFISAKARALPLVLGGSLFLATVNAEGRYAGPEDWNLSIAELDVLPTGEKLSIVPEVQLAGSFGPESAELSKLWVADKYSNLSGEAMLKYRLYAPRSLSLKGRLVGEARAKQSGPLESYIVDASFSEGKMSGLVDLIASPLSRIGKLPIQGAADGRIAFSGSLLEPNLDFNLKLRDGHYMEQSLALSASGSYTGKTLALRDVSCAYQGQSISKGSARFSFETASAALAFSYAGTVAGENLKFSLSAQGSSTSPGPGTPLLEAFSSYSAQGRVSDFSLGALRLASWPFNASSDSTSLALTGGQSKELRLKYAKGGYFIANLHEPFPVRADISGLYDGKNIDLSVQGIQFDLSLLAPILPPNLVKIVSGRARGGFHAMGLANDPEITGELDLENASVKILGWLSEDVGPFNVPIVARGRKLSALAPAVKCGKATLALSFQASLDHWLPSGFSAEAKTVDKSMVSLDSSILGIHAQGQAAADVKFALHSDVLALDCDVTVAKGTVIVSPNNWNNQVGGNERPTLFVAVGARLHFGRGVQVYFPSTDFPVLAGYSDPTSLLAITYDQASEDFTLKGTVSLRGGQVFYIQRNFFLRSGKIVFNEGTERFEPRVSILAELRDRNDDGPVLITLKAENAPMWSFQPRLSSNPPMTESQIAALMGQNLFRATSASSIDIRKAVISGTEFIPQLSLVRDFENRVRDTMNLDMLYVRTQVLQNWLIDVSSQTTASSADAMGRYLDQSELYLGKYLSDSIFAHASVRAAKDPLAGNNIPVIDSELGLELDTPFGLIQWNVTPKNWDKLLINDQSLSLSWKLSF